MYNRTASVTDRCTLRYLVKTVFGDRTDGTIRNLSTDPFPNGSSGLPTGASERRHPRGLLSRPNAAIRFSLVDSEPFVVESRHANPALACAQSADEPREPGSNRPPWMHEVAGARMPHRQVVSPHRSLRLQHP
jgi:hypothetical protein